MNAQREIRLYNHFTLFYVTLAGRETVDVWMADSTKWTRASARSRIRVHPNMDTILLKLPEASVTPGADDALIHLERGFAQRPEWLPSMAAVKWRVRFSLLYVPFCVVDANNEYFLEPHGDRALSFAGVRCRRRILDVEAAI